MKKDIKYTIDFSVKQGKVTVFAIQFVVVLQFTRKIVCHSCSKQIMNETYNLMFRTTFTAYFFIIGEHVRS